MKIGFFEIEGWEEGYVRGGLPSDKVIFSAERVDDTHIPSERDFDVISVFIDSIVTDAVLEKFPNLKFVTTRSTGFNHVDVIAAKKRNISVGYVPGYGDNTVAEFTFGLILSLTRKIYQAIDQVKESGSFSLVGLRGIDIGGKVLGVIGTGRIGREVITIAKGFGMSILAFDPAPDKIYAEKNGIAYVALEELLRRSDIVTIHCPYNENTHHLLNKKNIIYMKQGAYLINTARGGIIETSALVDALEKGMIAGAGLDVLEEEGGTKDEIDFLRAAHPKEAELRVLLQNHALMKMSNVLVTPHAAFNSQEALQRILEITVSNIKQFSLGSPQNIVKTL